VSQSRLFPSRESVPSGLPDGARTPLEPAEFSRRALGRLGLAAPTALVLGGLATRAALAGGGTVGTTLPPGGVAGAAAVCEITPGQVEGPYYFDTRLQRDDITEGFAGLPLRLQLTVISLPSCAPLQGAILDVWHCAADGRYSGYPAASGAAEAGAPGSGPPPPAGVPGAGGPPPGGPPGGGPGGGMQLGQPGSSNVPQIAGETFLRGYVRADRTGSAEIRTLYPGWYTGRTPHIHLKIWLGDRHLTTQVYLPDAATRAIYGQPPYNVRPTPDVPSNANDGIYTQTRGRTVLSVSQSGSAFIGRLTLAVNPSLDNLGQAGAEFQDFPV
jgi:protocatechuate 3,4-dioxygenase beta subunit